MASIAEEIRQFKIDNSIKIGDCFYYFENSKNKQTSYYSNSKVIEPDETRYAVITKKKDNSTIISIPEFVVNPKNNLKYKVSEIGVEAFTSTNVEKIIVTANLKCIKYGAFRYCKSLKSIKLPDSIEKIEECAFADCIKLETINIPRKIIEIPPHCFAGCEVLKNVNFADSISIIGSWAFFGCKKLEKITLPKFLKEIDWYSFEGCESLTSISIPESVQKIGKNSFAGCRNLEKVSMLGEDVELNENSFRGCRKLRVIEVPQNKRYPTDAFIGCVKLPRNFVSKLYQSEFSEHLRKEYNKEIREKSIWFRALQLLSKPFVLLLFAIGFGLFAFVSQFVMAILEIAGVVFIIIFLTYCILEHFCGSIGDSDNVMNIISIVSIIIALIILVAILI